MKGKFIPEIPGENVSYPGKNIPDPDRPEIKFPDPPTRNKIPRPDPKIFFKMFPDPGPVSVRSGETRGFGLPRRSLSYIQLCNAEPHPTDRKPLCIHMPMHGESTVKVKLSIMAHPIHTPQKYTICVYNVCVHSFNSLCSQIWMIYCFPVFQYLNQTSLQ